MVGHVNDNGIHRAGCRPDQRRLDGQAAQPRLPGHPAGLPGAEHPAAAGARRRHRPRPRRVRQGRAGLRQGQHRLPRRCSPTPTSTSCRSARRTCCTSEIGIAAAKAGKPFWIEKPVGRDAVDTAAVADAAREAGVATSIGYNYRHAPAVERIRELIANGDLGRITNVRAVFFNGYASEPNGALSWRFKKDLAGSGALGDLLSHVVDLMQYVVGPITEVTALLSTIHQQRPILPMGSGTHFAVIEDGELGDVENDDYAALSSGSRRTRPAPARSAPWRPPGSSSARSAVSASRSTAPRARRPGTSSR